MASRRKRNRDARVVANRNSRTSARCGQCGKRAYADELTASIAVGTGQGRGGRRVYQCPHGNGWHVTSSARYGPKSPSAELCACCELQATTWVAVDPPDRLAERLRFGLCDTHGAAHAKDPTSFRLKDSQLLHQPQHFPPDADVPASTPVRNPLNVSTDRLERRLAHVEVELADPPAGKAGAASWLKARTAELGAIRIELRRREFEQS